MGQRHDMFSGSVRRSAVFWAISAFGLLAAIFLNLAYAVPYVKTADTDFTRYVFAARYILEGRSPYHLSDYDYPPLLAFLLVPIAGLDLHLLHWLWFSCNVVASYAAALIFLKRWGATPEHWAASSIVWGTLGALPHNLALGQVNPLLLLLFAGWWTQRQRHPETAGVLLGLAAALKIWPLVLFSADVIDRNRRAVTFGLAAALIGTAGPLLFIRTFLAGPPGPSTAWYWLGTPSIFCLSFSGLALRLASAPIPGQPFPPEWVLGNTPSGLLQTGFSPDVLSLAGLACIPLAFLFVLIWKTRRLLAGLPPLLLPGFLVTATLVLMPLVWAHYYLVNYPMLSYFLAQSFQRRQWLKAVAVFALGVCLTWVPTFGLALYVDAFQWNYTHPTLFWALTTAPFVANLALLFLIVRALRQAHAEQSLR